MKKYFSEALGTYALIFFGTGAVVVNQVTDGVVSHLGVAVSFGLVVMIMIYALGAISGAHINPAVSIGFALTDRFDSKDLLPYIFAQLLGAILASITLRLLFPLAPSLGETIPNGSELQSFIFEFILTYFLMLVILLVSQNKSTTIYTPIAVGGTVLLEALFAGPICGASMNPARSFAPAIVSGNLTSLWLYLVAPILGAIVATWTWKALKEEA
ncbi:MAG: MIP/aquaporin family protein [Saprospiraceae bacterium]